MARELEGKVAVVTGAASGIGRATAMAMAREGAAVVVADIDIPGGEETTRLIHEGGGKGAFEPADVTDEAQVKAMVNAAVRRFGGLDCAFNNAGIAGSTGSFTDYPRETWDRIIAVNLTGTWLCMKHEIPRLLENGGGAIVNMSSTFGIAGQPGLVGYVATRHGVTGLTRAAALEYVTKDIRVNAVCPAMIQTPMLEGFLNESSHGNREAAEAEALNSQPSRRIGDPSEVADVVVWLCSERASFVTGVRCPSTAATWQPKTFGAGQFSVGARRSAAVTTGPHRQRTLHPTMPTARAGSTAATKKKRARSRRPCAPPTPMGRRSAQEGSEQSMRPLSPARHRAPSRRDRMARGGAEDRRSSQRHPR